MLAKILQVKFRSLVVIIVITDQIKEHCNLLDQIDLKFDTEMLVVG